MLVLYFLERSGDENSSCDPILQSNPNVNSFKRGI